VQSGIGFGLTSFSGFGCVTRDTGVCEALSKRGRAYRGDAQAPLDTHSAPYFHKSPRLWGSPGAVLTRTPETGRARIDERIQDSADGTKAHCKAARGLGLRSVPFQQPRYRAWNPRRLPPTTG
jgi:hypothetical protein